MARSQSIKRSGKHPGVFAIVDFFLDDLFPNTLGKPIFGGPESTRLRSLACFQQIVRTHHATLLEILHHHAS